MINLGELQSLDQIMYFFSGLLVGATVGYTGTLAIVIAWVGYHYVKMTPQAVPIPERKGWWLWS